MRRHLQRGGRRQVEAIDGRWQDIEPLARSGMWERLSAGCTGNPEPLFEAAALMGLGAVLTLSCGATVLLGIVVVSVARARARASSSTDAAACGALPTAVAAARRYGGGGYGGNGGGGGGGGGGGAGVGWRLVVVGRRRLQAGSGSEALLGCGGSTRRCDFPTARTSTSYAPGRPSDAQDAAGNGSSVWGAMATGSMCTTDAQRTTMRTTRLSAQDDVMLGNASLILARCRSALRPSRPATVIVALGMLVGAWIAATLFFDATAAAAMPYTTTVKSPTLGRRPPLAMDAMEAMDAVDGGDDADDADGSEAIGYPGAQARVYRAADGSERHRISLKVAYATPVGCKAPLIELTSTYARAVTRVKLVEAGAANATVSLEVDSIAPLPEPPTVDVQ